MDTEICYHLIFNLGTHSNRKRPRASYMAQQSLTVEHEKDTDDILEA